MKEIILAHLLMVTQTGGSLPVIGTPTSALIFALLFTAAILGLYLIVDHLPKVKKNRITPKNEADYAKAMIVLVCGVIASLCWDIWWHQTIGRDRLLIPPHIFLYSFILVGVLLSFYVWRHCRDIVWKHISFALVLVIVATPFDNFWHSIYGVENYSSPVRHALASPHTLLALSLLEIILLKYRKTSDFSFFGNLGFAAILATILGLLMPFSPTEGWGAVAGFAGAGIWALVFIGATLLVQRLMKGRTDATQMTIFAVIFMLITYSKDIAPGVIMIPHDRPPVWLFIFAFLGTAILLDITQDRFRMWVRGLFAGIFWAAILYGFSTEFFTPQFQYGMAEVFTAITFSAMGGLVAGSLASLHHLTDEKHIEKLLKKF